MNNILESLAAKLNADLFYREFSFSKNKFKPIPAQEREFADLVVWIDDLLIIFQLKQRENILNTSEETERKWFKTKVLWKAVRQVKDTLNYLNRHSEITIRNERGHVFNLKSQTFQHIVKLILYAPNEMISNDCLPIRHHLSRTTGFIHIVRWQDYPRLCSVLFTPAEVIEYFEFREKIIKDWYGKVALPSERALVGQFISGSDNAIPSEDFGEFLDKYVINYSEFDISNVLSQIGERIEKRELSDGGTDYYRILAEFAKLNREFLKEVKKRFQVCLNAVEKGHVIKPNRFMPRTGCGFIFIAIPEYGFHNRTNALLNLTGLAKYDQRLQRQIGVSLTKKDGNIYVDWCLIDSPWKHNNELETLLRDKNPFKPLKAELRYRYRFEK